MNISEPENFHSFFFKNFQEQIHWEVSEILRYVPDSPSEFREFLGNMELLHKGTTQARMFVPSVWAKSVCLVWRIASVEVFCRETKAEPILGFEPQTTIQKRMGGVIQLHERKYQISFGKY